MKFVRFWGSVNKVHFGEFYSLFVKYDGIWFDQPREIDGVIHFDLEVYDEDSAAFKAELCRLLPCVDFSEVTLWQKIKNFLTKKGDNCDQCC